MWWDTAIKDVPGPDTEVSRYGVRTLYVFKRRASAAQPLGASAVAYGTGGHA